MNPETKAKRETDDCEAVIDTDNSSTNPGTFSTDDESLPVTGK